MLHHGSYHQQNTPSSRCLLSVPPSCVRFSYRCCIRILIGTSSIPSKAFILQITVKLIASLKLHLRHGDVQPLRSVLLSPQCQVKDRLPDLQRRASQSDPEQKVHGPPMACHDSQAMTQPPLHTATPETGDLRGAYYCNTMALTSYRHRTLQLISRGDLRMHTLERRPWPAASCCSVFILQGSPMDAAEPLKISFLLRVSMRAPKTQCCLAWYKTMSMPNDDTELTTTVPR